MTHPNSQPDSETLPGRLERTAVYLAALGRASGDTRWEAAELMREAAKALRNVAAGPSKEARDWAAGELPAIEAYKRANPDWLEQTKPAREVIGPAQASGVQNSDATALADRVIADPQVIWLRECGFQSSARFESELRAAVIRACSVPSAKLGTAFTTSGTVTMREAALTITGAYSVPSTNGK